MARLQNNDARLAILDFANESNGDGGGLAFDDAMVNALTRTDTSIVQELSVPVDALSKTGYRRLASFLRKDGSVLQSLSISCSTRSKASDWAHFFSSLDPTTTTIRKLYIDATTTDRLLEAHEKDIVSSFFRKNTSIQSLDIVCYDQDDNDDGGYGYGDGYSDGRNDCNRAEKSQIRGSTSHYDETSGDRNGSSAQYNGQQDGFTLLDCVLEGLCGNTTVASLCVTDFMYSRSNVARQSLQSFLHLNEGVETLEVISDLCTVAAGLIDGLQCNAKQRELRITNFSEEASVAFFQGFGTASNVDTLEMTNCSVTGKALPMLVQGLRKNTDIRSLVVGLAEDISLSQFLKQVIAPAIMNHPSLKEVFIQDVENIFDHVGATALGDGLIQNACLERFTLEAKEITTNAAMFFGLRLPSMQFLKSITLVGTICEHAKQMLADKLQHNYSLTEVTFDPASTNSAAEAIIGQVCRRNQQIEQSKVVLPARMNFFNNHKPTSSSPAGPVSVMTSSPRSTTAMPTLPAPATAFGL